MSDAGNVARAPARIGTGWGFVVMLLGMLAMMTPFVSGIGVTMVVATLITAAGLSITMYAFKAGSFGRGLAQFLFGGITVLCGIGMFVTPVQSMFTLTAFLIAYFLVDGIFGVIAGLQHKGEEGWGWITISGIASVVLAVLMWRQWPATGAFAIGLFLGIRLIFTGWSIAMLGAAADAVVDVVEQAANEPEEKPAEG